MGTSSSGGSGSGSGSRAGSGGGSGGYISSGGQMKSKPYDPTVLKTEVGALFTELFGRASSYMWEMYNSSYLNNVYPELFTFSSLLHNQNSVEAIADRYKLDMDESGFILSLISTLHEKFSIAETDSRCIEAVRIALEKFLFKAVDDDPYLSVDANGKEVIQAMKNNTDFWRSLSGYFLLCLTITVYKKDVETKIPKATYAAGKEIERRTNRLITSYEQLSGNRKTNYKELFKYISQNWEWFKEEMKK